MALVTIGLVGLGAAPASASGPGQVCMFDAPSGAYGFGHVGWGYLVGGTSTWVFGSTENLGKSPFVASNQNSDSWVGSGTFQRMLNTFKNDLFVAGRHFHEANYYEKYRCRTTTNSSAEAAGSEVRTADGNGYNFATNSCLTKSVEIFWAYDSDLRDLSRGAWDPPNLYFKNLAGAGPVRTL